jgi:hypothetical protein
MGKSWQKKFFVIGVFLLIAGPFGFATLAVSGGAALFTQPPLS